jgi:hypothetical protein
VVRIHPPQQEPASLLIETRFCDFREPHLIPGKLT